MRFLVDSGLWSAHSLSSNKYGLCQNWYVGLPLNKLVRVIRHLITVGALALYILGQVERIRIIVVLEDEERVLRLGRDS